MHPNYDTLCGITRKRITSKKRQALFYRNLPLFLERAGVLDAARNVQFVFFLTVRYVPASCSVSENFAIICFMVSKSGKPSSRQISMVTKTP